MAENKRPGIAGSLYHWLDERVRLKSLVDFMSHKVVPVHGHSAYYYLGGLTLFFFTIQVATGILLLMYYRPGANTAYESVRFIISEVTFGWLIRALHSWSANLMILTAFLHMFTVYFTYAYRRPREVTWLTGVALLGLAMAFGFSGYLLPWNELSFFATRVGTGMAGTIPVIGKELMVIMRGGDDVTGATISRFFGLHVAVLPALFTGLLTLHLILIQRLGISEPILWTVKKEGERRYMKFFPNFMYRDLLVWLVAFNLLALLAVIFPDGIGVVHWALGHKADPLASAPPTIRPEWYFMFMFQALRFLPAHIWFVAGELVGVGAFTVGAIVWVLVPFIDKRSATGRPSPLAMAFGWFVVAFIVTMTALGYLL